MSALDRSSLKFGIPPRPCSRTEATALEFPLNERVAGQGRKGAVNALAVRLVAGGAVLREQGGAGGLGRRRMGHDERAQTGG